MTIIRTLVAAGLLAGCATAPPETQETLSLACQLSACTCQPLQQSLWSTKPDVKPVEFRPDGGAFCPRGYRLERKTEKPSWYPR